MYSAPMSVHWSQPVARVRYHKILGKFPLNFNNVAR